MAQKRLNLEEIDALLASMEDEEAVDDPCERQVEESDFVEDVGGAVGGPIALEYPTSDEEEDDGDDSGAYDADLGPLTIPDDETDAQELLTGHVAPVEEPTLTPVEERSLRRRRGMVQPPRGTPIEKIQVEELRAREGTVCRRDPQ